MVTVWADPLRPAFRDDARGYNVAIVDNERTLVALLRVDVYGSGRRRIAWAQGASITDDNGAPKQKLRALALLVRGALQHAVQLGIPHVRADVTPQLTALVKKITGHTPASESGIAPAIFTGRIIDWWEHAREAADGDGNVS
jgi:hypothetical protein